MAGRDHPQRLRQRPRRSDRGGGAGLGLVHRSGYRAAADNRVRVRAFARFDAALYRSVTERVALQANFENTSLADDTIPPGAPFAVRSAPTTRS